MFYVKERKTDRLCVFVFMSVVLHCPDQRCTCQTARCELSLQDFLKILLDFMAKKNFQQNLGVILKTDSDEN